MLGEKHSEEQPPELLRETQLDAKLTIFAWGTGSRERLWAGAVRECLARPQCARCSGRTLNCSGRTLNELNSRPDRSGVCLQKACQAGHTPAPGATERRGWPGMWPPLWGLGPRAHPAWENSGQVQSSRGAGTPRKAEAGGVECRGTPPGTWADVGVPPAALRAPASPTPPPTRTLPCCPRPGSPRVSFLVNKPRLLGGLRGGRLLVLPRPHQTLCHN